MNVAYLSPLRQAYDRMKVTLFHPFDLTKWVVVGFGCWLARLASGGGGGGGVNVPGGGDGQQVEKELERLPEAVRSFDLPWEWTPLVALIGCALVFVVVLLVVFLWLSSRGQFIFLDNVILNRAAVQEPWRQYRHQGNSLFLWRLAFFFAALFVVLLALAPGVVLMISAAEGSKEDLVLAILTLVIPLLLVAIAVAYVDLFLLDFVVPLMYRERLGVLAGWGRFLTLFRQHWADFLLYGLFRAGIHILVILALLAVILATCCIAGILLMIPYLGTLLLLPVWVTYRALSLEFLAQLGPDYDLFPIVPEPSVSTSFGSDDTDDPVGAP